jgi:glycosyltransferase involved in cell wall biosynthesis
MSLSYVIITPARNEAAFIERTIAAMIRQTVLPVRWVIVNDGSTDATGELASRYAAQYPWISVVNRPRQEGRSFAGKVASFNAGLESVGDLPFEVIGSLDADISFPSDYFEFLLNQFARDSQLGVAGTPFAEGGETYDYRFSSVDHVSGACQLFRRECFADIGGYVPLKEGGIDVVAVLTARMRGWKTRTFTERTSTHHRPMGSAAARSRFSANYKLGERAYRLGFHPVWQLCRCAYQMTRAPYVVGGLALGMGYCSAWLRGAERSVSREVAQFQGRDQMRRLRAFARASLHLDAFRLSGRHH